MTPGSVVDLSFVSVSEVSDLGVSPAKDVIAPADDLLPLAHHPLPTSPARFCQASATIDRSKRT